MNSGSVSNQRAEGRNSIGMLEFLMKCRKGFLSSAKRLVIYKTFTIYSGFSRYCITPHIWLCKGIFNSTVAVQLCFADECFVVAWAVNSSEV